ncbi:2-dehydropantoate 2-reductase [Flexivirga sp. ID2601S]|uniref:2-dehydropantoate 2-reductase n=1 Tax=Flexivirga aerilata TaxID=1656889 RepID=A0A849AHN6_9MICO|nr:2-dehydropantoate 2-reductase [Flexivirga aerilata]
MPRLNVLVHGLGSVGGVLAGALADGGAQVRAFARGPHAEAIRAAGGLRLRDARLRDIGPDDARPAEPVITEPVITERVIPVELLAPDADLHSVDLVIIAVKTTALADVARSLTGRLGDDAVVMSATNGIPWWFFDGLAAAPDATEVPSLDPAGMRAVAPADRVLGSVVHFAASRPEAGVVHHNAGNELILGSPAPRARTSEVADRVAAAFAAGGLTVRRSDTIQHDVWFKLWGNLTMNPLSAVTGTSTDRVLADPQLLDFASRCMREMQRVGERLGLAIDMAPDDRHAITRSLGAMRPSMLQDAEAGRPIELDALVGVVTEIARAVGEPTPYIDGLLGLTRVFARAHHLYPDV